MTRRVIGCMTGTSLDGLDVAVVEVSGHGLEMQARFIRAIDRPLGSGGERLRQLAEQVPMSAGQIAQLALDFAELHVAAIRDLLGGEQADLICIHGQTVFHAPPASWQFLNAAPIAAALRTPVVYDLRAADLAAGGQGAPITPLADYILFRDPHKRRAIVNLGGFCNITILPAAAAHGSSTHALSEIAGYDVCACNHILDAIARRALGRPFDADGAAASNGTLDSAAFEELFAILLSQRTSGRSLGTGDEISAWIERAVQKVSGTDLARTSCEAIASAVALAARDTDELIIAGGGAHNRAIIAALGKHAARPLRTTAQFGIPIEAREAVCFGILGALCQDRVPVTLSQVTQVPGPAPVAGVWIHP